MAIKKEIIALPNIQIKSNERDALVCALSVREEYRQIGNVNVGLVFLPKEVYRNGAGVISSRGQVAALLCNRNDGQTLSVYLGDNISDSDFLDGFELRTKIRKSASFCRIDQSISTNDLLASREKQVSALREQSKRVEVEMLTTEDTPLFTAHELENFGLTTAEALAVFSRLSFNNKNVLKEARDHQLSYRNVYLDNLLVGKVYPEEVCNFIGNVQTSNQSKNRCKFIGDVLDKMRISGVTLNENQEEKALSFINQIMVDEASVPVPLLINAIDSGQDIFDIITQESVFETVRPEQLDSAMRMLGVVVLDTDGDSPVSHGVHSISDAMSLSKVPDDWFGEDIENIFFSSMQEEGIDADKAEFLLKSLVLAGRKIDVMSLKGDRSGLNKLSRRWSWLKSQKKIGDIFSRVPVIDVNAKKIIDHMSVCAKKIMCNIVIEGDFCDAVVSSKNGIVALDENLFMEMYLDYLDEVYLGDDPDARDADLPSHNLQSANVIDTRYLAFAIDDAMADIASRASIGVNFTQVAQSDSVSPVVSYFKVQSLMPRGVEFKKVFFPEDAVIGHAFINSDVNKDILMIQHIIEMSGLNFDTVWEIKNRLPVDADLVNEAERVSLIDDVAFQLREQSIGLTVAGVNAVLSQQGFELLPDDVIMSSCDIELKEALRKVKDSDIERVVNGTIKK